MLPALRHKNYRLFLCGQFISLIGTWMQQVGLAWLVYRLTNSAFLLGIVGFAGQVPTFLLTPFAGVLVDRWNRHRLILATQALAMVQAFILSILVLGGRVAIWQIILLTVSLGIVNAFDLPARQSFVSEMVESRQDFGNAIALNSSMVNGSRLFGPALAGIVIAAFGEGICFLLNGISYLAVLTSLVMMKVPARRQERGDANLLQGLREGVVYAFGLPPIRAILLLLALVSLFGMPYATLLPIFAGSILHGGAKTFGFLLGAAGMGAFSGSLYLTLRKNVTGLGRIVTFSSALFGIGLVAFSRSQVLWLSLVTTFLAGLGMMVQMASSNIILQTMVEDDKRGRIMSLYTAAFMGMAPFGNLFAGIFAARIGAPNTVLISGMFCLLGSLVFAGRLSLQRGKSRQKKISPLHDSAEEAPLVSWDPGRERSS